MPQRCCRLVASFIFTGRIGEVAPIQRPAMKPFDADLKTRNLEWGVRDLEAVAAVASNHGFSTLVVEEMPANNLSVVFRKH
jgi:Protein of unknown function (DUF938)